MYLRKGLGWKFVGVCLGLVLLLPVLVACGGKGAPATSAPPPTTVAVAPTATPTSAATPTPTETVAPTATPTPTAITTATATPTPSGPVKIGVVHDFSGPDALSGQYYGVRLIKLATKEWQDAGGVLGGRQVEYDKYDCAGTVAGAQTAATKAILQDHVAAVILGGSASADGEALSTIAQQDKTLYVNLFVLPLDISNNPYVIRPGYRLDEMNVQLDYAIKVFNVKKIAIFARDFEEDHMYADSWKKMIEAVPGGQVVYEDFYPLGTLDFTPYLTKMKYANPDVLISDCLLADYPTIASQMQGLGGWGNIKHVGSMAMALALGKPGTDGWYIYARWLPGVSNDPGSVSFVNDYHAMFGTDPDNVMELMYEPFMWAVKAVQLAGTDDPVAVAAAARSGNLTWDSPQGPLTISKDDGECYPRHYLMGEFVNGKIVPVPPWTP
jgi:urea transport system substrate-binding protein